MLLFSFNTYFRKPQNILGKVHKRHAKCLLTQENLVLKSWSKVIVIKGHSQRILQIKNIRENILLYYSREFYIFRYRI